MCADNDHKKVGVTALKLVVTTNKLGKLSQNDNPKIMHSIGKVKKIVYVF